MRRRRRRRGAGAPVAGLVHVRVSFGQRFPECQRTVACREPGDLADLAASIQHALETELPPPASRDTRARSEVRRRIGRYDVEYTDGTTERFLPEGSVVKAEGDRAPGVRYLTQRRREGVTACFLGEAGPANPGDFVAAYMGREGRLSS